MILGQITALQSDTRDNFALKEAIRYQIARFRRSEDQTDLYRYAVATEVIEAIEALLGAMRFEAVVEEEIINGEHQGGIERRY